MEISFIFAGVITVLLVYCVKKYIIDANDYWRKLGVPTASGALPFVGHSLSIFFFDGSLTHFMNKVYKANKGRSVMGYYQFRKPQLMLMDPELVKTVLISNFSKFHSNGLEIDPNLDPLLAQNPFFNVGEKWKSSRNRLSYALISGKRLRILCHSVNQVCEKFTKHLREKVNKSRNGVYEFEGKVLGNLFTGEVVARAGFGVEGDFFAGGTGPNSFREVIRGFFEPSFFNTFVLSTLMVLPFLNKILRIGFLPNKIDRFFRRVVHEMIMIRKEDKTPRNDFLQLMLDNSIDEGGKLDELAVTASATSFFVDGYETSAITLSFLIYALAKNPEVQEKLRNEVKTVLEKHGGVISYECLKEMTFMDKALNESMRLLPAVGFMIKKCTERCQLVGKDGLSFVVEPGTTITIPVAALQRDPEYWENSKTYCPERFEEAGTKDQKFAFLPFGEGPRMCVGMKFAVMQIKGAVATILKDFSVEVSSKTKEPLRFTSSPIMATVEGGLWLNLKPL